MAFYRKFEHSYSEDDSSSNNETIFDPLPTSSRFNTRTLVLITTTTSILALVASIKLLALYSRLIHELHRSPFTEQSQKEQIIDCGKSRPEALERWCTFNVMANA
jgi:hypothetical protein